MMKTRSCKHLFDYWNEVRGDRLAPRRFEIEPARLAGMLPDAFILERFGDMDIRYRLAGTRVVQHFGREFRGSSFFDGLVLTDKRDLESTFRRIINEGGGALLEMTSSTASGRRVIHEFLILPLVHLRDTVDRFVGCISAVDAPDWLGDEPLVERLLTAQEALFPDAERDNILSFPEPPVFGAHVRTARIVRSNRRYFRVYEGGLAGGDEET